MPCRFASRHGHKPRLATMLPALLPQAADASQAHTAGRHTAGLCILVWALGVLPLFLGLLVQLVLLLILLLLPRLLPLVLLMLDVHCLHVGNVLRGLTSACTWRAAASPSRLQVAGTARRPHLAADEHCTFIRDKPTHLGGGQIC